MFKDKCLLITGGTGSFGNAVLKRFLDTDIKEIRIFSRDEKKQDDMRNILRNDKVKFYMGDVRDFRSIDNAMEGVDYVFHAAALKQVPSCEFYPMEAVRTNVLGTENVVEAAIKHKIEKVICLGTDKAVYPINAMGISKAMMEKVAISKARLHTKPLITCTRYGNVMASRGSVIPLFISQIKSGKPLTITDPEMTRFMMSLDNAVELVLFAYKNANPGDIFVQKAPASTIGQLARILLELFGVKNEINVIGTRHGEKLYETLLTREEFGKAEDMGDFYRIAADDRDLNYAKYFSEGDQKIAEAQDYHSHNTHRLTDEELKNMLLKLDYVQEQFKELIMTELIKGNSFTDNRGTLKFVNDFTFPDVKRFYQIIHPDIDVVRAWQGHKVEHKYFYVVKGKFAIACVEIDNWDTPSPDLEATVTILEEGAPSVLSVPAGFANGIKALEADSILMVYSNLTLQESAEDRWSFDAALWFDWKI